MQNLDVTTATFGTSDLCGSSGDIFPSATQRQISENTGWTWYGIETLAIQPGTAYVEKEGEYGTGSNPARVYLYAGNYMIRATGSVHYEGLCHTFTCAGSAFIEIGGTTIASWGYEAGFGAFSVGSQITGSLEFTKGSDGWTTAYYRVVVNNSENPHGPDSAGSLTLANSIITIQNYTE